MRLENHSTVIFFYHNQVMAQQIKNANKHLVVIDQDRQSDDGQSRSLSDRQKRNALKLLQIKLPNFNGKFESWLELRDTFLTLIHSNVDLDDLEKFHYLRSALSGSASDSLRSIQFTTANYNLAWEHICKRFNNESMIVTNPIAAILNLSIVSKQAFSETNNLFDEATKHLQSCGRIQNSQ